ncbi:hypothetical protein [Gilliamella sp. Nev3-1]|nr:hypothetical protein [Gilliamella apicola]
MPKEGVPKIDLFGPTHDVNKATAVSAVPTTFIIYTARKKQNRV